MLLYKSQIKLYFWINYLFEQTICFSVYYSLPMSWGYKMNRYIHSFCFPFCSFISIPFYLCLCIPFLSSKFLACCTACGILDPNQGSKPCTLQWKHRVLTTGRSVSKKKKKEEEEEVLPLYFLVHLDVFSPGPCASLSTLDPLVSVSISS